MICQWGGGGGGGDKFSPLVTADRINTPSVQTESGIGGALVYVDASGLGAVLDALEAPRTRGHRQTATCAGQEVLGEIVVAFAGVLGEAAGVVAGDAATRSFPVTGPVHAEIPCHGGTQLHVRIHGHHAGWADARVTALRVDALSVLRAGITFGAFVDVWNRKKQLKKNVKKTFEKKTLKKNVKKPLKVNREKCH